MSVDETKKAKTIVERIKKLLFNCDLTIVYANGEIKMRSANMKMFEGSKKKNDKKQFITNKIDKERFEIFVEDVEHIKDEILENLDMILDKYESRYKVVFVDYFLQNKSYQEISDKTHYSLDTINKIIRKLKQDLISFYIP